MIAEIIFFSLMYYVAGLLLALLCFHDEYLWNIPISEHGPAVIFGFFLFVIIWPIVAVAIRAMSFRSSSRRSSILGVYYGGN